MNNITFKKDLLGVQDDLLRFAYKLTSDREEANDLLQETSLKALDNEEKRSIRPILISKDGYTPSCAISSSTITAKWCVTRLSWIPRTISIT